MSPYSYGRMYAELANKGKQSKELNVLIIGGINDEFRANYHQIKILRQYLNDIDSSIKVKYFGINSDIQSEISDAVNVEYDTLNYDEVRDYLLGLNIDLIVDVSSLLIVEEVNKLNSEFGYVSTYLEFSEQVEAFLAGNNVPWSLSDPIWNNDWLFIYSNRDGASKDAMQYMDSIVSGTDIELPEKNHVRSIANRLTQIEHAKLLLFHAIILKRRERRITQDYTVSGFEVHYHLGNYYFLIAGLFDMLSRHLNRVYEMGLTQYRDLGIEKDTFIAALERKDATLVELFREEEFVKWLRWLKDRRNYIAHEATISITTLVKEPESRMPQEEVDRIVEGKMDWSYMRSAFGMSEEHIVQQKQLMVELIRMGELEVEIEDIMTLDQPGQVRLFMPLNSINIDHEKMSNAIIGAISRLRDVSSVLIFASRNGE